MLVLVHLLVCEIQKSPLDFFVCRKKKEGMKMNNLTLTETRLISSVSEKTENWKSHKLKSTYVFTYADYL